MKKRILLCVLPLAFVSQSCIKETPGTNLPPVITFYNFAGYPWSPNTPVYKDTTLTGKFAFVTAHFAASNGLQEIRVESEDTVITENFDDELRFNLDKSVDANRMDGQEYNFVFKVTDKMGLHAEKRIRIVYK